MVASGDHSFDRKLDELKPHRRAGDARTERQRRARVVKGWAFEKLTTEEINAITDYLAGGPVPPGYEELDRVVR